MTIENEPPEERRNRADRRVKRTAPDDKGAIHAEGYDGPDRRAVTDRRSYHARKRENIRREKMAFLNRTTLSAGFLTAAVLYAVYFLLAPEIAAWDTNAARVREMDAQMAGMRRQMAQMQQEKQVPAPVPVGSAINHKIEQAQSAAADALSGVVGTAEGVVSGLVAPAAPAPNASSPAVQGLIRLLSSAQTLNRTPAGQAALAGALAHLRAAVALNGGGDFNPAVSTARLQDPTLDKLLAGIDPQNLGAAAFLLSINQLRGQIDRARPFADDLALVEAFANGDEGLTSALLKLAPYALNGIAGRAALQAGFKAVAGDIVMAKFSGQDATLAGQALQHLAKLVKVRRVDDITGDSVDASVARAEILLDNGDVAGAVAALRGLQGPPAFEAAPWIGQAQGYLAAAGTSDILSQTILQILSAASSGSGFSLAGVLSTLQDNLNAPVMPPAPEDSSVPYISPSMQSQVPPGGVGPYVPK